MPALSRATPALVTRTCTFARLANRQNLPGGGFWVEIVKNVNGVATVLSRRQVALGIGTMRFEVKGGSLKLFYNDELVGNVTDTSMTGPG